MASLRSVERWDVEADVVVLGFGLAGAIAAIEAHDTDPSASVIIVEKMPKERAGGNSRASGQRLLVAEDPAGFLEYQRALNEPHAVPEDVLQTWAQEVVKVEPWVRRMAEEVGMSYIATETAPEHPSFPGASSVRRSSTIYPGPSGVWKCFQTHVERRPIAVIYQTRARDFVQDPDTLEVFGAICEQNGAALSIRGRRATIMCMGGFENNLSMQRNFYGLERAYTLGSPANQGDGIPMLQKTGARLWHMRPPSQTTGFMPGIRVPDFEAVFFRRLAMHAGSWIEISKANRRFYDESSQLAANHYKQRFHGHWIDSPLAFVLPVHMIFDEATRAAGPIASWTSFVQRKANAPIAFGSDLMSWNAAVEGYIWSQDNSAEIEKGWIMKAASLPELARLMERDADEVQDVVDRFNHACTVGHDDDYGRPPSLMERIDTPPYYAVDIVPAVASTTGGAQRNALGQVLDYHNDPIPRLFEAGELGSILANLYQSGSLLSECIVSGRLAGRHGVKEVPIRV